MRGTGGNTGVEAGTGHIGSDGRMGKITVLHQNMQSLPDKTLEFEVFLDTLKDVPDVLCITEHWMRSNEIHSVKINKYVMASCWCRSEKTRGGSCIYVGESLGHKYTEIDTVRDLSIEGHIECSAVELDDKDTIVICVYRPCTSNQMDLFFTQFISVINVLKRKLYTKNVVICGDFNIDLLKNTKESQKFRDILLAHHLYHTITEPTRVTEKSKTLIDNIMVNKESQIMGIVVNSALADHHAQMAGIPVRCNLGGQRENCPRFRDYSQTKLEVFESELSLQDWSAIMGTNRVDLAYGRFSTILTDLADRIFTWKTARDRKPNRWMTKGIKTSCANKRRLLSMRNEGLISNTEYKNYCRILKKVIRRAKQMSQESLIQGSHNKTRATWQLVNEITKDRSRRSHSIQDGFKTNTAEELSDLLNRFNKYFIEVAGHSASVSASSPDCSKLKKNSSSLYLEPTDSTEILRVINSLKNTKSVGYDNIPVKLLKMIKHLVSEPLAHIVNLCLSQGIFPSELKISTVYPIYKKGPKTELGNYRPVSILSNVSKIFEKIIYTRIMNFVETKNVITERQNGFRRNRGTTRAMYQLVNEITKCLNNGQNTAAVFMDLSKAFDCVEHNILMEKIGHYGLRGMSSELVRSYLTDRKQYIADTDRATGKRVQSAPMTVKRGVPQGSILGPLLFILYINDLPEIVEENVLLYADDTTVSFGAASIGELTQKIEHAITHMNTWFDENCLTLNINKTQLIRFSYPLVDENSLRVNISNGAISSVDDASFLGIQIDRRLDWRSHIEKLAQKTARYAYALKVIARNINVGAAMTSYYAYIQSSIRYGIIMWGNSVDSKRIFKLQKACVRNIFGMQQADSCRPIFKREKILTLYGIYILEAVRFISGNRELFTECIRQHGYSTRNRDQLIPAKPNLTYIRNSVHFTIVKIYNKIPQFIRGMEKSKLEGILKRHLLDRAYYSLTEYLDDDLEGGLGGYRMEQD